MLVDEAEVIVIDLGVNPLLVRIDELRAALARRRRNRSKFPDGLSEREIELLQFLAAGRSNRDIGEELFMVLSELRARAERRPN